MSQVREIKCPHCGEWTMWNGNIDDRCLYCSEFLEPQRLPREVEKKINKQILAENDYFFIKSTDGPIKRWCKHLLNSMRWLAFYVQIAFFLLVTVMLVLITIIAVILFLL